MTLFYCKIRDPSNFQIYNIGDEDFQIFIEKIMENSQKSISIPNHKKFKIFVMKNLLKIQKSTLTLKKEKKLFPIFDKGKKFWNSEFFKYFFRQLPRVIFLSLWCFNFHFSKPTKSKKILFCYNLILNFEMDFFCYQWGHQLNDKKYLKSL